MAVRVQSQIFIINIKNMAKEQENPMIVAKIL